MDKITRKPQDADKYIVRFPDGMRDRLKAAGQAAGRSLNAEIVYRLEQSFRLETAGLLAPVVGEAAAEYVGKEGGKGERIREMLRAVRTIEVGLVSLDDSSIDDERG